MPLTSPIHPPTGPEPDLDDIMCSLNATARMPKGMITETREVIAMARKFKAKVMKPYTLALDRHMQQDPEYLPWEFVQKANAWGVYTMWIPKAFGGRGYNLPSLSCFLEETASECLALANLVGVHYLAVATVFSTWNIGLITRLCRAVRQGEKKAAPCLMSTAVTEPDAGTDVEETALTDQGNITCIARKVPGGYVVNGTKVFISNAHLSQWHILIAYADARKASEHIVILAVQTGTEGFRFGRKERKMGVKGCPAGELIFNECFVPDALALLTPDQCRQLQLLPGKAGARILDYTLAASRAGVGAFGTGAARGAYECALDFAMKTEVDGKLLINHEWAQSMLAEMYKNAAAARLTYVEANYANGLYGMFALLQFKPIYYCLKWLPQVVADKVVAPLMQLGTTTRLLRKRYLIRKNTNEFERISGWGSLAKFAATDAGVKNCHMAVELMGQAGLRQDMKIEKMFRDAKLLQIYEGTNQLNRMNLFKCLLARNMPAVKVFEHENSGDASTSRLPKRRPHDR
ncbi:MAG: acyl-CoA dehydrogenase family protein [Desulfobacteraceae bacterium]|jgi:alkylation response protein AidB-like acyl-CoA dehydrogenase